MSKINLFKALGGKTPASHEIKPHSYKLRLMSDEEIKNKSEVIFTYDDIISKNYTLDSANFGCTNLHTECSICGNDIDNCPGHMGVIVSPFPFVKTVCVDSFKTIVEMICPICSRVPLSKRLCAYIEKSLTDDKKIPYIQKRLQEWKSSEIVCPWCGNKITLFKIIQKEPLLYVGVQPSDNVEPIVINPLAVQAMLQNFTQFLLVGWPETYRPGDFMSCCVPIIPNKLRMKSIDNSVSIITTFYKNIVEEIVPELGKLYKVMQPENLIHFSNNSFYQQFRGYYDKLVAYYSLITDSTSDHSANRCLEVANKNDRKHFDKGVSCVGRIKDKENSMFNKGIISTRVDDACRSVLGGAPDCKIMDISVPNFIANKLTMKFTVYEENIKTCKQIVAAMSNPSVINNPKIPRVQFIEDSFNKFRTKITPANAQSKASMLKPGDKIELSLVDGYFVLHCRFPSIREESWSSQRIKRSDGDIICIPLTICEMKTADFDGDESQIYVNSSTCYQLESLLLHSCARMLTTYKNGNFIIWYDSDVSYGIPKIKTTETAVIKDYKQVASYKVIDRLSELFPKDLSYEDSKTKIVNGKFVDKDKCNINNMDMMEYIKDLYGPVVALNIMDGVVNLAYDLNKNDGATLGFEIILYDDSVAAKLAKMRSKLYLDVKNLEKTNSIDRKDKILKRIEQDKPIVHKMIDDQAKNTSIYKLGFLPKFLPEYSHVINQLDYIKDINEQPFSPILAENTRTLPTFPKYSIDPCAYGFVKNGYADDISTSAMFYQCKKERFSLYTKSGEAIGKQGYLQKRLSIAHSGVYADFNHASVDNHRLISLVNGCCGLDPRKHILMPLFDIALSDAEFKKKYGGKTASTNFNRIIELRSEFKIWMDRWAMKNINFQFPTEHKSFVSGFNWIQYCKQHLKEGKSDEKHINRFITSMLEIVFPEAARKGMWSKFMQYDNFKHHEYFFRILFGYHYVLTDDEIPRLLLYFNNMLVNGGEPVGMKAANSIAEPMSQLVLKAIHGNINGGASDNNVKRMGPFDAFETLLGGKTPKEVVITIGLYDDSFESSKAWAESQETFFINDIWSRADITIANHVDKHVRDMIGDGIDFSQIDVNPMMISMNIAINKIAAFNIHVADIFTRLTENYPSILFIAGYPLNAQEFKMLVYFTPGTTYETINNMLEEWSSLRNPRTLVHGQYLCNCYVCENKNRPGHYVIQANEVVPLNASLENLIYNEEVDPAKCHSSNIDTCISLFGVCETNARHILECVYTSQNISATSGVLPSHYKLVSDNAFSTGKFLTANRYSLHDDDLNDPLRMISYETPRDFIAETIKSNRTFEDNSNVSSLFFGGKGAQYSGDMVSKIMLYEVPVVH